MRPVVSSALLVTEGKDLKDLDITLRDDEGIEHSVYMMFTINKRRGF